MKRVIILIIALLFSYNAFAQLPDCTDVGTLQTSGEYLINQCCTLDQDNTTYKLSSNITINDASRCFYINYGQNKILDLNGFTLTYDALDLDEVLNPSFEVAGANASLAANWDFSNAPNASRVNNQRFWRFGEDHTIVIPGGSSPQYIESNTMNLPAGEYRAMYFFYANVSSNPQAFIQVMRNGSPVSCSTETLRRPAPEGHWWYHFCNFSNSSDATFTMRVGTDAVTSADVIIDMAELRPRGSTIISSVTGTRGSEISNGIIRQGPAKSYDGGIISLHPSTDYANDTRVKIYDLEMTTTGSGNTPIFIAGATGAEIYNNWIYVQGTYNRDREVMISAVSVSGGSNIKVHDNHVFDAYQTGLKSGGNASGIEFYNNEVRLDTKLTNGYAIEAYGANNVKAYNNTLTGNGRGIHFSGDSGGEAYGNTIDMREYINPEYQDPYWTGMQGNCAHGIKVEGMDDVYIHDNDMVRVSATQNTFVTCPINITGASNVLVEDNKFYSVSDYVPPTTFFRSWVMLLGGGSPSDNVTVRNNEMHADQSLIYHTGGNGFILESNTIINTGGGAPEDFELVFVPGWPATPFTNFVLLNNTVVDGFSDNPHIAWVSNTGWNYFTSWTLSVRAQDGSSNPIPNTTVTVTSTQPPYQSFSATTDGSGIATLDIPEFEIRGSAGFNFSKTDMTPYGIVATTPGGITQGPVIADIANPLQRNIVIEFSETEDITPPSDITDLALDSCGSAACTISWTATGDDGMNGTAAGYEIRYSVNPIDAGNFSSATLLAYPPIPQISGTSQNITVYNLEMGQQYYFAMKIYDEIGNISGISNVITGTTQTESTCGDINGDGSINLADILRMIEHMFKGLEMPDPPEVLDINLDESIDIADIVYLINYVYRNGPTPCATPPSYIPEGQDWTEGQLYSYLEEVSGQSFDLDEQIQVSEDDDAGSGFKVSGGCGMLEANNGSSFLILILLLTSAFLQKMARKRKFFIK